MNLLQTFLILRRRDASGCLPGCDWPRDSCTCPVPTFDERIMRFVGRAVSAAIIGGVAGWLVSLWIAR